MTRSDPVLDPQTDTLLTLSAMVGFYTHISNCSDRGQNIFLFIGASAIKRKFKYVLPKYILSKGQKPRLEKKIPKKMWTLSSRGKGRCH